MILCAGNVCDLMSDPKPVHILVTSSESLVLRSRTHYLNGLDGLYYALYCIF